MTQIIANLEVTPSQVSGRLATWHRMMEEAGLTYNDLQTPINDPGFRSWLVQSWQTGVPAPAITRLSIVSGFDYDKSNDDWKLLEDTLEPADFDVSRLELVPFLESGESYTGGETMLKRARGEVQVNGQKLVGCNFGQRHGEAMLRNQHLIPLEMRGKVIVLPGTIWQGGNRDRLVPCLVFHEGRWFLDFDWLVLSFFSHYQLLRLRELPLVA